MTGNGDSIFGMAAACLTAIQVGVKPPAVLGMTITKNQPGIELCYGIQTATTAVYVDT